ncbi:MAG: DOMON domain-containing protein [Bacteroidota bacterium]
MKQHPITLSLLLFLAVFHFLPMNDILNPEEPKSIMVGDMSVQWVFIDDMIEFEIHSPLDGWVALGFNDADNIVGTNLIMANCRNNQPQLTDMYVVGFGDPRPVHKLGSQPQAQIIGGNKQQGTQIRFRIPQQSQDKYHFDLRKGQKIWLICAYSESEDLDHHSRMRRHVEVEL